MGSWLYEYRLNNSSFTSEQWDTINSGVTKDSLSVIEEAIEKNTTDIEEFKSQVNPAITNLQSDVEEISNGLDNKVDKDLFKLTKLTFYMKDGTTQELSVYCS